MSEPLDDLLVPFLEEFADLVAELPAAVRRIAANRAMRIDRLRRKLVASEREIEALREYLATGFAPKYVGSASWRGVHRVIEFKEGALNRAYMDLARAEREVFAAMGHVTPRGSPGQEMPETWKVRDRKASTARRDSPDGLDGLDESVDQMTRDLIARESGRAATNGHGG